MSACRRSSPSAGNSAALMTLADARFWARTGVLAALALVLSYIETFIPLPVPVPGVKLGLANVVVLLALEVLDVKSAAVIALVKVLAAGLMFGNPVMMLYSAGGTVLAFAAMALLSRVRGLSVVLVAVVGAILHNVGQLAVASVMLGTPLVWASAPLLVIAACATGALSGVATRYALGCLGTGAGELGLSERPRGNVATRSQDDSAAGQCGNSPGCRRGVMQACLRESESGRQKPTSRDEAARVLCSGKRASNEQDAAEAAARGAPVQQKSPGSWLAALDARVKIAALVIYITAALHARTLPALVVCALLAAVCAIAVRLPMRSAIGALRPLAVIVGITVVMQVLYVQQGDVLFWAGPVAVTRGALAVSACMVVALMCIMVASVCFMRCTSFEQLLDALRWALRPFGAFGWRADALLLSLTVAIRFVPVLVDEFACLKRALASRGQQFDTGGVRSRLRAYALLFAPLVRNSFRRADTLAEAFVARCFR